MWIRLSIQLEEVIKKISIFKISKSVVEFTQMLRRRRTV
jgi:hypothetical protein